MLRARLLRTVQRRISTAGMLRGFSTARCSDGGVARGPAARIVHRSSSSGPGFGRHEGLQRTEADAVDPPQGVAGTGEIESLLLDMPETGGQPVAGKRVDGHVGSVDVRGVVEHVLEQTPVEADRTPQLTKCVASAEAEMKRPEPSRRRTSYFSSVTSSVFSQISAMAPEAWTVDRSIFRPRVRCTTMPGQRRLLRKGPLSA